MCVCGLQLGLKMYHGVGILGFNSAEWFISDLAAIFAGFVMHVSQLCSCEQFLFMEMFS